MFHSIVEIEAFLPNLFNEYALSKIYSEVILPGGEKIEWAPSGRRDLYKQL